MWTPPDANVVRLQLSTCIDAHRNEHRAAKLRKYGKILNEAYLKVSWVC
jgi:hypothetical protein